MALELVSKQDAYEHLRLDYDSSGSADDGWLDIFIPAISEAVAGWIKEDARLYVAAIDSSGEIVIDSSGEPVPDEPLVVRPVVRAAVLVELESQYRFRSGDASVEMPSHAGYGYTLGRAATNLLTGLRRPTVA